MLIPEACLGGSAGAASSHVPLGQSVQVLSGSGGAAGENMEILKPGEKLLRSESTSETVSKAPNSLGDSSRSIAKHASCLMGHDC